MEGIPQINEFEDLGQKESTLLEWEADEYNAYERNWKWYALILAVSLGVIGWSIYSQDWIIIAIVFVVDIAIFLYAKKLPRHLNYRITQLGVYTGDHFYPYGQIHSFWISYRPDEKKLNLIFLKKYLPQLSIILNDVDPLQIKTVLSKYLPEQENRSETLVDHFMRILKL